MLKAKREWLFRVVYRTSLGRIDVDYMVDTLAEAKLAIDQGPYGLAAVEFMAMMRAEEVEVPNLDHLASRAGPEVEECD